MGNKSNTIKTVLGCVSENEINAVLGHEHICCYSEYLSMMSGNGYINFSEIEEKATAVLIELKALYGLNLFIDCTPVNIGRNVELLKRISEKSGVHIVCSTGFYYTEEPVLYNTSAAELSEHMVRDAEKVNAGIIKAAVENESLSSFNNKLLTASAMAHKALGLPIVVHTNANNKSGMKALEVLLNCGVSPEAVVIGHLSDTDNMEYVLDIARSGCYIGLDRIYDNTSLEYITKKVDTILKLSDAGFGDKIILSHDEQFFNGFDSAANIKEKTRFSHIFEYICPRLEKSMLMKIIRQNPIRMLSPNRT